MAREDRSRLPAAVAPMLASVRRLRAVMRVAPDGTMALASRNDKDLTAEFAALAAGLGDALGGQAAVLDGELVVLNEQGQPEFALMQERRGRYQQGLSTAELPVRFLVFDLLQLGDTVLTGEPYDQRRHLLDELDLPDPELISTVPAFTHTDLAADGLTPSDLLAKAAAAGFEGLISKRRASRYYPGRRSPEWLKHPLIQTQEVIVCGWRPGKGRRTAMIGGLLLGAHDPATGDLVYLGDVGTGFTEHALRALQAQLEPLERRTSPFTRELSRDDARHVRWVEPEVVGEVVYRQFTRTDRRLRHAAWRGLRPDRDPAGIIVPEPTLGRPAPTPETTRVVVRVGERQLSLSNLDKQLYPDGTTTGEVINYYSRIAPLLLPHLAGRPVTFIRFPDGVGGQSFFEKNVSRHAPAWVSTVRLPSSGSGDTIDYPLIDDLPTLVIWGFSTF